MHIPDQKKIFWDPLEYSKAVEYSIYFEKSCKI